MECRGVNTEALVGRVTSLATLARFHGSSVTKDSRTPGQGGFARFHSIRGGGSSGSAGMGVVPIIFMLGFFALGAGFSAWPSQPEEAEGEEKVEEGDEEAEEEEDAEAFSPAVDCDRP